MLSERLIRSIEDAGTDTVVFAGRRSQYTVTRLDPDGSEVIVRPRGTASKTHVTILYDVEFLKFKGLTVSTAPRSHTPQSLRSHLRE